MRHKPLLNILKIPEWADFLSKRKFNIHSGIDLYCSGGDDVFSIEDGIVRKIDKFTSESIDSGCGDETYYIGILSKSGYIVYGKVSSCVQVGEKIKAGQKIGHVLKVFKKDRRNYPSMLHLEFYKDFIDNPIDLTSFNQLEDNLLNPRSLLTSKRFEFDAEDFIEALEYLKNRASQILATGWKVSELKKTESGILVIWENNGNKSQSFYILKDFRGKGFYQRNLIANTPVLTLNECDIVDFLENKKIPYFIPSHCFINSVEYNLISDYYGDMKAERSGVLLMNHIDEGIHILQKINASESAIRAFIIHPMIQSDKDLEINYNRLVKRISSDVIALSMEYRNVANRFLSKRELTESIELSPLIEVNQMLIADKVQNRNDFKKYHLGTHNRSETLSEYFKKWLKTLHVDDSFEEELLKDIENNHLKFEKFINQIKKPSHTDSFST